MFSEFSTQSLRKNRTAINQLIYNYNNNHENFTCPLCTTFTLCKDCIWSAIDELMDAIPTGNVKKKKSYFEKIGCCGFYYNDISIVLLKTKRNKDHELGIKLRIEDLYKWKKLIQEELRRRQGNLK